MRQEGPNQDDPRTQSYLNCPWTLVHEIKTGKIIFCFVLLFFVHRRIRIRTTSFKRSEKEKNNNNNFISGPGLISPISPLRILQPCFYITANDNS